MKCAPFLAAIPVAWAAGWLALLAAVSSGAAVPTPAGHALARNEPGVQVISHRYLLDPTGTLETAAVAAAPERFQPLPAWWQRDPPGIVRWEQLVLRWQEASGTTSADAVLHLRTMLGNDFRISYAPNDPHCGNSPPQFVNEQTTPLSVTRWATVPLCAGAQAVYLRFNTTRDAAPLNQVETRAAAARLDFTSTANTYGVAFIFLLSFIFGLVGTWRGRDLLWPSLLLRTLLVTPYFAWHGAAPANAPSEPLIRWVSAAPPDLLLVLVTLGQSVFLLGFLWSQTKSAGTRQALLGLCGASLAAVVLAVVAPYPIGVRLALTLTFLSGPVALAVAWRGASPPEPNLPLSLRRSQQLATWAVVLLSSFSMVLVYHSGYWRLLQFSVVLFHLSLAVWVTLRAASRRTLAAAALFAEQLSRQRADERAREQEERRLETRDLMLMLTHEIRTPLAVLRLSVDAAGKSEQARRRVHEAIGEMDRLIERCLETARLEIETPDDAVDKWVARQALREIAGRSRSPERVQLHVADGTDLPRSRPVVINAIVAILADNALRYGAPTSLVTVDALPAFPSPLAHGPAPLAASSAPLATSPGVAIVVSNAVGPLGPPDPVRVFQKYYRGPGAHRHSGAGLGLYLASRLVDRLGGTLTHASTAEHTRFTLWIPR